ncbi:MAG: hypothetical protein ABIQ12_04910 [Opitutaceae bacterium]
MRLLNPVLLISLFAISLPVAAKPLIGGPKTIAVDASGTVAGSVASPMMGQGSYTKGATKVAVPLIAVAFETSAQARVSSAGRERSTVKSLELRLSIDDAILKEISAELQSLVEKDLAAQGFEILPKESIDTEARWLGIAKDGKIGEDVKDNFMSGFMGNGSMNRWFTAGDRPLFGTGATGALSELSPLIRTARERKISLLFYRFKVQFTELESKNAIVFNYVKGKNVLHMVSADVSVFTPEHTLGGMIKLTANLTAGSDFVQELQGSPGRYKVIANPAQFKADSLLLIQATSKQFAQALRKAQ